MVTNCSALLWFFTSQSLSPNMHRCAASMIKFDMDLKRRKVTDNVAPDVQSHLRRKGPRGPDIDTTFPK